MTDRTTYPPAIAATESFSTGKLRDYFDAIFLISLPYCPERRDRALRQMTEAGLIDDISEVTVFDAVSGDRIGGGPEGWPSGNGAWGCLLSHHQILCRAATLKLRNYVVFEDDVIFHPESRAHLKSAMDVIARRGLRWGQFYLGGQHLQSPMEVDGEPIVRCRNINRTHAFAVSESAYAAMQRHILFWPDYIERGQKKNALGQWCGWHIDHQLGIAHERREWETLAPRWWIAGQGENASNISGKQEPDKWWQPSSLYSGRCPVVLIPPKEMPTLVDAEAKSWIHAGWNLDEGSFTDAGLRRVFDSTEETEKLIRLKEHLIVIAREALDLWRLPAVSHPGLTLDMIREVWPSAIHWRDLARDDAESWPFGGAFAFETGMEHRDALKPEKFAHL